MERPKPIGRDDPEWADAEPFIAAGLLGGAEGDHVRWWWRRRRWPSAAVWWCACRLG